ncbi:MAG TPA: trypsin-like serine protease [Burkholderiaceae bacterium]|nr:trypsin-like serine protease [Burkholderiaceae bacterium]
MTLASRAMRLAPIAALLAGFGTAHAMSNNTAPSNWRFNSSSTFNGVNFDGVARLLFDSDGDLNNGAYVCSGTLLAGGMYVLTAGHCADNFNVMQIDFGINNDVATATRGAAAAYLKPGWNGTLSTGADMAIIKLDQKVEGIQGFNIDTQSALGKQVLMMGYGTTTVGNTATAPNWNEWGHGHYGYNTFDVTSKVFLDAWDGSGDNTYGEEFVADYDGGPPSQAHPEGRNNTLGIVAGMTGNLWTSNNGDAIESLITGGDSGGGDFVWNGSEWLVTGVHSWGWQFCGGRISPSCDYSSANSGSWGDLMASTAVYSNVGWINSIAAIPEPETYALMLAGLAVVASVARRRRNG